MIFHDGPRPWQCFKGSRHLAAKARVPSERTPKTMGVDVEFVLIHGFAADISRVKGVSGYHCGGWALGQSGDPG